MGDYYGWIQHNGFVMGVLGTFGAFTFAAICLIITSIADPSAFYVQVILLFLTGIFFVSMYLLGDSLTRSLSYCRRRSLYDRHDVVYNVGIFVLFYWFGLVVTLVFLIWGLFVLFGISLMMYVASGVLGSKFIVRPFLEKRNLDRPQSS